VTPASAFHPCMLLLQEFHAYITLGGKPPECDYPLKGIGFLPCGWGEGRMLWLPVVRSGVVVWQCSLLLLCGVACLHASWLCVTASAWTTVMHSGVRILQLLGPGTQHLWLYVVDC
jgi:hypothetical protein